MKQDKIMELAIATDNVPIFSVGVQIMEEKASLKLLADYYSGSIGQYMEYQSDTYCCNLRDDNNNSYGSFRITKSKHVIELFRFGEPHIWTKFHEFCGISLFQLFQTNASYTGIDATSKYFGM